jgi:pentapeptide repeat protein
VETGRRVTDPSGNEDTATRRFEGGQSIVFNNTDFTFVTFQNVDFGDAAAFSTTFQACGLQDVDFRAAQISGRSPTTRGDTFEPTFDNSIMEGVSFDGATLANVSFRGVDFSGGGNTFNGATLENVDFTGATGLQNIDWEKVNVTGNVYGLAEYAERMRLEDPSYVRSLTFDGVVPEIDPDTGWDIDPETGYLMSRDRRPLRARDRPAGTGIR